MLENNVYALGVESLADEALKSLNTTFKEILNLMLRLDWAMEVLVVLRLVIWTH